MPSSPKTDGLDLEVIAGELTDADYDWLADLLVTLAMEEEGGQ